MKRKRSMNAIPNDVVLEILPKLPLKSLFRFKCVSKQWLTMIPNLPSKPKERILLKTCEQGRVTFYSLDRNFVPSQIPNPFSDILRGFPQRVLILGSCNGLVLCRIDVKRSPEFLSHSLLRAMSRYLSFMKYGKVFFIWNPTTSEAVAISPDHYLFYYDDPQRCIDKYGSPVFYGFCYDSSFDDYKVIFAKSARRIATVYSLKRNTAKLVSFRFGFNSTAIQGPVVDGRQHWKVFDVVSRKRLVREDDYDRWEWFWEKTTIIGFFDPVSDKFGEVPLPEARLEEKRGGHIIGLGVLDECLCMSRWAGDGVCNDLRMEVLVMKEYGVRESWTRMFVVDADPVEDPVSLSFMRFVSGENCLGLTVFGRELTIEGYDPMGKPYKRVLKISQSPAVYQLSVCSYFESSTRLTSFSGLIV